MNVLGVDVGGTGTKGAVIDTLTGAVVEPKHRLLTPKPATPQRLADTIAELRDHFDWRGPIGIGLPSVIQAGVVRTAAHISDDWIGVDAQTFLGERLACPITLLNDADAAGLAEVRFGAGQKQNGVVLMLTLGTGIGSALFINKRLVPNTELGHLVLAESSIGRCEAEGYAADSIRKRESLDWHAWAERLNQVIAAYESLLWPDLIILGGGGSKKFDRIRSHLRTRAAIVPAEQRNLAGIIGAACAASTDDN